MYPLRQRSRSTRRNVGLLRAAAYPSWTQEQNFQTRSMPAATDLLPAHATQRNAAGRVEKWSRSFLPSTVFTVRRVGDQPHDYVNKRSGKLPARGGTWPGVADPRARSGYMSRRVSIGSSAPELPASTTRTPPKQNWDRVSEATGVELADVPVRALHGEGRNPRMMVSAPVATTTCPAVHTSSPQRRRQRRGFTRGMMSRKNFDT